MPRTKPPPTDLKPHSFFATNAFFRHDEFISAYTAAGHSQSAATAALAYYSSTGVILSIRRGIYMVEGATFQPWLLPSKITPDAVLAYDGAASLHGLSGLGHSLSFLAPRPVPSFTLSEVIYRAIAAPRFLESVDRDRNTISVIRDGHSIDVTSLERTLVDCCERIDLAPDLEELFDGFLEQPDLPLDLDALVEAATAHAGGVAAARLGLLLSSHPRHRYAREHLAALARRVPKRTSFATRDREFGGQYFRRWRLVVPHDLAQRLWNQES